MSAPIDIKPAEERESALMAQPETFSAHLRGYFGRVRGGDMGALPAVLGIVVLSAIFGIVNHTFLTKGNFANLLTQGAPIMVIAMGLVFVLLLGEIDLAAGYTSGVAAATMAVLLNGAHPKPLWITVLAAIGAGVAIGLLQGLLVAKVGIPSFVVTLAGFLAWQGVVLWIVGEGGTIVINNNVIDAIEGGNMSPLAGWILLAVVVVGYAVVSLGRVARRQRKHLAVEPMSVAIARVVALAVLGGAAVFVLNENRSLFAGNTLLGVPWVVPILLVLLIVGTFVLNRTTYGRHIYATGGNTEAARRAGIRVDGIRISVFVLCSAFAAVGGIIAASRLQSVDPQAGGGNTLLFAVGAAVIGGTSLFGGRGKIRDAVLGGAVIAIIANGMSLLGWSSAVQFVATGVVLLIAAGVDALSRKTAAASGLA
jgi:D-xylose transport system permease protein